MESVKRKMVRAGEGGAPANPGYLQPYDLTKTFEVQEVDRLETLKEADSGLHEKFLNVIRKFDKQITDMKKIFNQMFKLTKSSKIPVDEKPILRRQVRILCKSIEQHENAFQVTLSHIFG